MEKRRMEKLGVETSLLGFGCMRFPTFEDGTIDREKTEKMIDAAYQAGVNYFDTAYAYHYGKSEEMIGKILSKYDRNTYYLATKMPMWLLKEESQVIAIFEEQLERLQTDHVDFYLLHSLNKENWEKAKQLHILEKCEEFKKQGKIKYLGFSFHDSYEVFEGILSSYHWDFCQIQYNYMDREEQAGDRGYALAEKLQVPMVIMEPVRGGRLASFSKEINDMFYAMNPLASVASYAMRWVASHPNVKVVLSGMSTMEQVQDNLNTFCNFKPLSEAEEKRIEDIVAVMRNRVQNGCTGCQYCMPCPAGVDIPACFRAWNEYHVYGSYEAVSYDWEQQIAEEAKPKNCIGCGKCESVCPQHLSIREDLKRAQKELEEASGKV